ncbi:VOC family protein [Tepidiforma thermophila]|uniref:Glyoxalase-like protein n=1 Tax=Tepidiforma thermophila (strain KCTC 52669 / CGMCC 1.13589 / G233) TaxID=2761530 RepID=A0A2A9HFC2_TEPT2|nr:VOC family protein [Tepidiforma thermophila]PFG74043.1 glyoxalase-like protein [Tepidiforma thermophila]
MLTRIDHLVLPVAGLDAAAAAFERLGLVLTPRTAHAGLAMQLLEYIARP